MPTVKMDKILAPGRAAKYLGTSRMTLWRWVREGKIIPVVILGNNYFHTDELDRVKKNEG